MKLASLIRDFREIIRLYPDVKSIARRMFVTNSLDGIVAAMGVNVGGFSQQGDPGLLASSILGGSIAMGIISGIIGVYLSERAERLREYRELEKKLASDLRGSVYWKAVQLVPIYIALWSGVGILLFPLLLAAPYLAASRGLLDMATAYTASLVIGLASMGWLGYYLGRVSGENVWKSTARTIVMGLLIIVLVRALRLAVG